MPAVYRNIARVQKAHGSKGEVRVVPLRGLPFLLRDGMDVHLNPPALKRERISKVLSIRPEGDSALVRFSCAGNIGDAEAIEGTYVLVRADSIDLPPLVRSDEELLGREVVDARHGSLGRIAEVIETPANRVWSVCSPRYGEILIPVIEDCVESIPDSGPVCVTVMDGLLDL